MSLLVNLLLLLFVYAVHRWVSGQEKESEREKEKEKETEREWVGVSKNILDVLSNRIVEK